MSPARQRFILSATASYTALALAWIFLSDQLLAVFADLSSMVWLSTAKGVFFVLASAAAFAFALRTMPSEQSADQAPLLNLLAAGITPGWLPRWLTYAFAVALTLAMLLVRAQLDSGDHRLLIVFMFPIILSALLGGFGPGLLSTAVAALGVAYIAIPPLNSFRIASGHDLLQWSFLIANGVAVSLLSEVLRRSLVKAESNRRLLDTVISGTPDAVFVKDRQGRYLLANAATASFVGQPPEQIIGRDDHFLFPEASARAVMTTDSTIMAAGRIQTHEEHVTTIDGKALIFLATKGPAFDANGQIVGLFGIARDITDRKRAEDEIHRLNSVLEQRVLERTAELQAANHELEALAYALTHNLRAPLRAINGFAQLLVDDHAGEFSSDARRDLDQIRQAGGNMGELIEGILALLRCTRGELDRETVDISALATQRLGALARNEPQRPLTWQVEAGLSVVGDADMLKMALAHLLDNAWKFTRCRPAGLIRVYSGALDGQACICVADNGAGFDMAHAERLFQPFQRLHRQDEFPGTGIGLATVQRIIQRHRGSIRAEASPGAGATFYFSLPSITVATESHHE